MKQLSSDLREFIHLLNTKNVRYIHNKSIAQLLHRARKESLKRTLAHEELSATALHAYRLLHGVGFIKMLLALWTLRNSLILNVCFLLSLPPSGKRSSATASGCA